MVGPARMKQKGWDLLENGEWRNLSNGRVERLCRFWEHGRCQCDSLDCVISWALRFPWVLTLTSCFFLAKAEQLSVSHTPNIRVFLTFRKTRWRHLPDESTSHTDWEELAAKALREMGQSLCRKCLVYTLSACLVTVALSLLRNKH